MNAVEIEEAVSQLAEAPFDPAEFPYQFLAAFGNKDTTIKRLRSTGKDSTNKSDLPGGVLQRNNIHLAVCNSDDPDEVGNLIQALAASPATAKHKAKFALATNGKTIHAQNLCDDAEPPLICEFKELGDHFGYFLALAGISTVKAIRENSFDIKATGRLNKLYIELLKHNENWGTDARREDLNHFFARLIFCFFAEDTRIFGKRAQFTDVIQKMTKPDGSDTAEVLSNIFQAMDVPNTEREKAKLRSWAAAFPYVNGGLFSGAGTRDDVPAFTKIARSYLLNIGSLDWTKINPDIFGSMIQAVADDEERGALGMHYTSVPNILKVLNPLFLDDLREKLEAAGDGSTPASKGQLKRLRDRLARIRVFDPACGSGNFLVIAYKEMREIEAEINKRRGEPRHASVIPLTNFRGIEIRHFACEIARLALVIAEFQCNELYLGQDQARIQFLPLERDNWITHGNALRLDWLQICPPTSTGVKLTGGDLFNTPLDQAEIDFENAGGETYICGNPPYLGNKLQSEDQKSDLKNVFEGRLDGWKSLDYVAGWVMKAVEYGKHTTASSAFVTTNSICQGQQVPILWPPVFRSGYEIIFAHTSFKWANLATNNAGVIVIIVGISNLKFQRKRLYSLDSDGAAQQRICENINPYLVDSPNLVVEARREPPTGCAQMLFGNMPRDGGNLIVSADESSNRSTEDRVFASFLRLFVGSEDFIQGRIRYCLWIEHDKQDEARMSPAIADRLEAVRLMRLSSKAGSTRDYAKAPYRFVQIQGVANRSTIIVPRVSSERRPYLPIGLLDAKVVIADSAFALYDAPLWNFAILASRLHLVWIAAVCGKLKTDYRYSNTLGWNTFPLPPLTETNKSELTRCAEEITLAREAYFPDTIADLYDQASMPLALKEAHDQNDEVLERIYVGRRFRNDTERLEKLFELYASSGAVRPPLSKLIRKGKVIE